MRDVEPGTDIQNYLWGYESVGDCGCLTPGPEPSWEVIWGGLALAGNSIGLEFTIWLTLVILLQSLLWMVFSLGAARAIGVTRDFSWFVMPITLLAVQTYLWAGQTNILRSGLAVPLGALAALAMWKGRLLMAALLSIGALGIHFVVGLILAIGLLFFVVMQRRAALTIFAGLSVVYLLGASTLVAGWIVPESLLRQVLEYGADQDYRAGVRPDFLVFTTFQFLLVALLTRTDTSGSYGSRLVPWLSGLAVPFLLVGGVAAFSDRWLQPLWSIAPIVVLVLLFGRLPPTLQFLGGICSAILMAVLTVLSLM